MQNYCRKINMWYNFYENEEQTMILSLEFNNYRMFKDNNILSFSADTRIKRLLSNTNEILNRNVLKSLSLYGQNNIGKSNIVDLFSLIKGTFLGVENLEFNRRLFQDDPLCEISIIYKTSIDNSWMNYAFAYNSMTFEYIKEELNTVKFYETGLPHYNNIFTRNKTDNLYQILGQDYSELLAFLPSKKSLLYSLSLDNDKFSFLKPYLDSFNAFGNSIEVVHLFNIPIEKTIDILKSQDERKKQFVLSFVKNADLSVSDFFYNDDVQFLDSNTQQAINERALAGVGGLEQFKLYTKYGNTMVPSFFFDSTGTKKIEAIASYLYEAIVEGKTLIVDELDNGLHFKLSRAILSAFNSFANKKGQLIFTAHDVELITCKHMMRKDQIYFAFRDEELKSSLFCLKEASVEEGGPRTAEDLLKHYNRSEFGYVPAPNFLMDIAEYIKG